MKQETNLGKRNNQNFVQIPHHKFIEQLKYKADKVGIKVIINEKSYTKKHRVFTGVDNIPNYSQGVKHKFSGQGIKRGLYFSKNGFSINADLNDSYNTRANCSFLMLMLIYGDELGVIRLTNNTMSRVS